MGIQRVPFYNKVGYGHAGDTRGTHSLVVSYPDDSLTVSYCINGQQYPHNDVAIGLLSICYDRNYDFPVFRNMKLGSDVLDRYAGIYSTTTLPLKITVGSNKGSLTVQATGQPMFLPEAVDSCVFKYDAAGLLMTFDPTGKQMVLKQGGQTYLFKKD